MKPRSNLVALALALGPMNSAEDKDKDKRKDPDPRKLPPAEPLDPDKSGQRFG
jgi:hypothetical protein